MTITIRRLADDEWTTLRDLRLAALAESPAAFWATLTDEQRNGPEEWTGFLLAVAWFVATCDKRPIGLAGGLRRREAPDVPEVIGMWVEPAHRRHGVAGLLLGALDGWARSEGGVALSLWVVDDNAGARGCYERCGFRATGERAGLPARSGGRAAGEERMLRAVEKPSLGFAVDPHAMSS